MATPAESHISQPAEVVENGEKLTIMAEPKPADSKKTKKKEERSMEHVLRVALNGSGVDSTSSSAEEKLGALCRKYAELQEDVKTHQSTIKQNQKKATVMLRERDQLQAENSKLMLGKSKLESLCRELQKHNKVIKEESLARTKEEDEKRKEANAKLQVTITDIQTKMKENNERNLKTREENLQLTQQLKAVLEQCDAVEKHMDQVKKHHEVEKKLIDARLQKAVLQLEAEKESHSHEKQELLRQLIAAKTQVNEMQQMEIQLKGQLTVYTEKYADFQSTLSRSNEVFTSFKKELDKMTKKCKKLDKEATTYKGRWEASTKTVLQMAQERQLMDTELKKQLKKNVQLESLCRALRERNPTTSQPDPVTPNGDRPASPSGGADIPSSIAPSATDSSALTAGGEDSCTASSSSADKESSDTQNGDSGLSSTGEGEVAQLAGDAEGNRSLENGSTPAEEGLANGEEEEESGSSSQCDGDDQKSEKQAVASERLETGPTDSNQSAEPEREIEPVD